MEKYKLIGSFYIGVYCLMYMVYVIISYQFIFRLWPESTEDFVSSYHGKSIE